MKKKKKTKDSLISQSREEKRRKKISSSSEICFCLLFFSNLSSNSYFIYLKNRCGPCRLTVPVVKDVMKQYSGELDVVEICTDELAEVAENSGVLSIPTIQFYYDGAALETHSIVGCVAKSVLSNAIDKVIEDVAQINKINNRL